MLHYPLNEKEMLIIYFKFHQISHKDLQFLIQKALVQKEINISKYLILKTKFKNKNA